MKKDNPLARLVRGGAGQYVLNQKSNVFEDRRTRRTRSRAEKKRKALEEEQSS